MNDKEPTIKERLTRIEKFLFNEVRHELRWHRWILIVLFALAVAKLFV